MQVSIPDLKAIEAHLGVCPWQVQVFEEVTSTNTLLKELGRQGAPAGTVLVADRQTGGRGRLGRTFLSPGGVGVYLSALIRPDCAPTELMHLTCAVAVAMCDAVETAAGLRPGIKWINDLVCGSRKLGGILTELSVDGADAEYAVVGIGINCCQKPEDFPADLQNTATSLSMVTGKAVDRAVLAAAMVDALHQMDLTEKAPLMARYRADCVTLGKPVAIHKANDIFHGTALDVDPDGGLLVRLEDGSCCTVSSGEVSVRGLYGYI